MKNVVILAAGPPKVGRNRHLEVNPSNQTIIIEDIIDKCRLKDTNLFVVISKENIVLKEYLQTIENLEIITPKDDKIYSTFESALSVKGDVIMVCGDLINLRKGDVDKFADSEYDSATCVYDIPWGDSISSNTPGLYRRGDVGDCMGMISEKHKKLFLSEDIYESSKKYYKKFNPASEMNEYVYNDVGTFMSFSFFKKIWSDKNCNSFENIGSVKFNHRVYLDND